MSEWGSWSACSVTCGGGYQMRTRTCHDPLFGGKNCTGEVVDLNPSCNSQSCPSQSEILLYSIFFVLRLFRQKKKILNVVFIFFKIFASQEPDSFMTRINDSKEMYFSSFYHINVYDISNIHILDVQYL